MRNCRNPTYRVWSVCRLNTLTLKEEADGVQRLALPLAERSHQLLELRRTLDLEENLVIVVRDLDIQMLGGRRCFQARVGLTRAAVFCGVGHGG